MLTYDQSSSATGRLFGNGKPVKVKENSLYTDLGDEGSPVVMNIEINKEMENAKEKTTKKKGTVKGKANATNASNNTKKSVAAKKKG